MTRYTRSVHFLLMLMLASMSVANDAWCQIRHGDKIVTVVNHASPNVRSAPRISPGTLMGTVPRGTQMKLVAREGSWYQVIHPDGKTAYIFEDYAETGIARDLVEVTVARARLRESATTASRQAGQVTRGTMLPLVRKSQNWFLVMLPGNQQGWLRDDLGVLRPLAPPLKAEAPAPRLSVSEQTTEEITAGPQGKEAPVDPFAEGREFAAAGDVEEAVAAFRRAVEADPAHSDAHFELALLLKDAGQTDDAVVHFKAAGRGARPRPEARFYLEELLQTAEEPSGPIPEEDDAAADGLLPGHLMEGATVYVLPALGIGSALFLVVLAWVYRRRRGNQTGQPMYRRRKQDAGFDSVLKYAVEKRPLLRTIEEAERKRAEMDVSLQKQLETFQKGVKQSSPQLPGGESTETLLKRLDDLRQTVLNQDERAKIYAELVVLQNEKLQSLDEEIEALKKLIQLDYRDSQKQPQKAKPPEGGAPQS